MQSHSSWGDGSAAPCLMPRLRFSCLSSHGHSSGHQSDSIKFLPIARQSRLGCKLFPKWSLFLSACGWLSAGITGGCSRPMRCKFLCHVIYVSGKVYGLRENSAGGPADPSSRVPSNTRDLWYLPGRVFGRSRALTERAWQLLQSSRCSKKGSKSLRSRDRRSQQVQPLGKTIKLSRGTQ